MVNHVDHVCQLAGNALHSGIGTDLDGGFGREQTAQDLETIVDLACLPELLAKRVVLLRGNPFYHFIELVRAPLLGKTPELETWIITLAVTLAGSLITFLLFRCFRSRIAYWL